MRNSISFSLKGPILIMNQLINCRSLPGNAGTNTVGCEEVLTFTTCRNCFYALRNGTIYLNKMYPTQSSEALKRSISTSNASDLRERASFRLVRGTVLSNCERCKQWMRYDIQSESLTFYLKLNIHGDRIKSIAWQKVYE